MQTIRPGAKPSFGTKHSVYAAPAGKVSFYDPGLDLLRFFAFLMVFGFHAHKSHVSHTLDGIFKIGKYGVGVFFVLSAYLITELLLRESEKTGTVSLSKFYIRRVLRIWPLYFLVLILGVLFGIVSPHYHVSLGKALCFSFLLGNIYAARYGVGAAVIYPLWTLSIEEQFYAVIPALMKRGGRTMLGIASVMFIVIAYAALFFLGSTAHIFLQNQLANYNSFVQFQFFAAGTLLALLLHNRSWKLSLWARVGALAGSGIGMSICIGALLMESPEPRTTGVLVCGYLLRLLSTTALFLAFLKIEPKTLGPLNRFTYFGRISYGLYLYHAIVIALVFGKRDPLYAFFDVHFWIGDLAALLGTVLMSAASYRWFEKPILRWKARFEVIRTGTPQQLAGT